LARTWRGILRDIGINDPSELRGRDPEGMYEALCRHEGHRIDRCVLYAFRCAVYYASSDSHDPELLKWWNWKESAGRRNRMRASEGRRKKS